MAELNCGHGQHVRHNPPFVNRPWVTSQTTRLQQVGTLLNCVRCDRLELPEYFVPYRRTRTFNENTVPAALMNTHTTKRGVWATVNVLEGGLRYTVQGPLDRVLELGPDDIGVIPPEVPHKVTPIERVRFFVEFYRSQETGSRSSPQENRE